MLQWVDELEPRGALEVLPASLKRRCPHPKLNTGKGCGHGAWKARTLKAVVWCSARGCPRITRWAGDRQGKVSKPDHATNRRAQPRLASQTPPCLDARNRALPRLPCHASPRHALPSHAKPSLACPAVPCLASPRHALPAVPGPAVPCLALPCLPSLARPRPAAPSHA